MKNEPLGEDLSYTPLALAGGLIPPAIQLSAIAAFLVAAHPDPFRTLGAIILSLIWLRTTEGQLVTDYAGQRERAKLFGQVGEWLGYSDGPETIRRLQEDLYETGDKPLKESVTAETIRSFVRDIGRFALCAYFLCVTLQHLFGVPAVDTIASALTLLAPFVHHPLSIPLTALGAVMILTATTLSQRARLSPTRGSRAVELACWVAGILGVFMTAGGIQYAFLFN